MITSNEAKTGFLWALAASLVLTPVAYFILRICDTNFRDAAVANWFGTVLGVVIGIPVGLAINRYQQQITEASAARVERQAVATEIWHLLFNVGPELPANIRQLLRLKDVLAMPRHGRRDMWDVALKISESFSSSAFADLRKGRAFSSIFPEARPVVVFYLSLEQLARDVRTASALHDMAFSHGGGEHLDPAPEISPESAAPRTDPPTA